MTEQPGASFNRFTERARKVLTLAQEEAQRFNHNYIGTEHLLLGLIREGEGVGVRVLAGLGIEPAKVRSAMEFILGRGERQVMDEIALTPQAKKVIELSVDESHRLGHTYVGTEHLLLGLIQEGEGIAAGVLESVGVNLERAQSEVMAVLAQTGAESDPGYPPLPSSTRLWDVTSPGSEKRGWAYLVLHIVRRDGRLVIEKVMSPSGHSDIDSSVDLYEVLSRVGALGWELVGIDQGKGGEEDPAIYVFKRPL